MITCDLLFCKVLVILMMMMIFIDIIVVRVTTFLDALKCRRNVTKFAESGGTSLTFLTMHFTVHYVVLLYCYFCYISLLWH